MKVFKFFEYAYLIVVVFFLYQAYVEYGQEGGRSVLFLAFSGVALFMFFFKRKFRKKFTQRKDNE